MNQMKKQSLLENTECRFNINAEEWIYVHELSTSHDSPQRTGDRPNQIVGCWDESDWGHILPSVSGWPIY